MLEEIFQMQAALEAKMHRRFPDLPPASVEDLAAALIHEAVELRDCFGWKWWARDKPPKLEEAKEELSDVLHFVVSIALRMGMTAEELFNAYSVKNRVNVMRQESNY